MRRRERSQRANRVCADNGQRVGAARRARRQAVRRVEFDVGRQVNGQRNACTGRFALFQRKLVGRRVNLAEVVDASIGLRGGTRLHEVGNRNGCQKADDGHDDHDFNQREARFTGVFNLFHLFCFRFVHAAEQRIRRVINLITFAFRYCLMQPRCLRLQQS